MKFLLNELELASGDYESQRRHKKVWEVTGPILVNKLNKDHYLNKYCVVCHMTNDIYVYIYRMLESAQKKFNDIVKEGTYACMLMQTDNFNILGEYGLDKYTKICKEYIKNLYDDGITVFPTEYFYPISWHGIYDCKLHKKIDINPNSFMFQYGMTTNNLKY